MAGTGPPSDARHAGARVVYDSFLPYAGGAMKQLVGFVVGVLVPALILAAGGISSPAVAQAWPSKPIRILIAQAPGSGDGRDQPRGRQSALGESGSADRDRCAA